jgi:hypothetical protein
MTIYRFYKIILGFLLLIIFSCELDEGYIIDYSVCGSATTATITYYDNGINYTEEAVLPWSKSIIIPDGEMVGLIVRNTSDGEIDCRIFFTKYEDKETYKRAKDLFFVTIKGVIHSL